MKGNPIIATVAVVVCGALAASVFMASPAVASAEATATVSADQVADPIEAPVLKPAPVLVVSAYRTSHKRLLAGSPFTLTLDISNETARRANNVVVSLAGAAGAAAEAGGTSSGLTVLGTGNAKFVGDIRGDRVQTVSFDVVTGPGTPPGAVAVPVTISFEYDGVRQELTYTIGLVLERDATFSVTNTEIPKTAMVGESFDASFELANTGSFTLSGMLMSVEASNATVTDASMFVGAFEAAAVETLDVTITPEKSGPMEVVLVAKYRDDFGREKTYRSTYEVEVEGEPKPSEEQTATGSGDGADQGGNWFVRFFRALFGLEA